MNDQSISPQENVPGGDLISPQKSLFAATVGEIFWRNFLAGASRALGAIVVYIIFLVMMMIFMTRFVLPQVMPMFDSFNSAFGSLGSLNSLGAGSTGTKSGDGLDSATDADLIKQLQLLQGFQDIGASQPNVLPQAPSVQSQTNPKYQATPIK